jgi:3',5'-cyclic AMP phosphodiesterase CpdA
MRIIAHISDLHFGTEDPDIVAGLLADLERAAPHLILVSGDLTQRARTSQFVAARKFLDALPAPYLVVPGNHDLPLYNVWRRMFRPLHSYRRHIHDNLLPEYADEQVLAVGLNTARSQFSKNGRISPEQIAHVQQRFSAAHPEQTKILITHHPFFPPDHLPTEKIVGRGRLMLEMLARCGCDLVLAGHLHWAYRGDARTHHAEIGRSILVIQAGTATSSRRRGEPNAYNLLTLSPAVENLLTIDVRSWNGAEFASRLITRLQRDPERGWVERGQDQPAESAEH